MNKKDGLRFLRESRIVAAAEFVLVLAGAFPLILGLFEGSPKAASWVILALTLALGLSLEAWRRSARAADDAVPLSGGDTAAKLLRQNRIFSDRYAQPNNIVASEVEIRVVVTKGYDFVFSSDETFTAPCNLSNGTCDVCLQKMIDGDHNKLKSIGDVKLKVTDGNGEALCWLPFRWTRSVLEFLVVLLPPHPETPWRVKIDARWSGAWGSLEREGEDVYKWINANFEHIAKLRFIFHAPKSMNLRIQEPDFVKRVPIEPPDSDLDAWQFTAENVSRSKEFHFDVSRDGEKS